MSQTSHHLSRGEQKSLAYHQVVARRVSADPSLLDIAKQRLDWYRQRNPASAFYYDRWNDLLTGPMDTLIGVMVGTTPECCALRQENPFVDLITQKERSAIYRDVAAAIDRKPQ